MLIDTHAHIYLDPFEDDLDEVLDRARGEGVGRIVLPAIDVPSIHRALELCGRYQGLYAMAALHPSETKEATEADFDAVVELCESEYVVAVGETGLDYYWDRSFDGRQQAFLRKHIQLAASRDLPIVFHNREAFDDLIRILEEERSSLAAPETLRGIFHCFTGTVEEARRIARSAFLVGIGGILTFKNAKLDASVREIPLEQIVLETDSPYLAPEPFRGKRNEPSFLHPILQRLAEIKQLPPAEVAAVTTRNAERLFGLADDRRE